MNIKRINQLIDLLESIPETRFDISRIVDRGLSSPLDSPQCNSTACALGWLTTEPDAKQAGFKLVPHDYGADVLYDGLYGLYAGASYLGISKETSARLFGFAGDTNAIYSCPNEELITPSDVARELRRLLSIGDEAWLQSVLEYEDSD